MTEVEDVREGKSPNTVQMSVVAAILGENGTVSTTELQT